MPLFVIVFFFADDLAVAFVFVVAVRFTCRIHCSLIRFKISFVPRSF